MFQQKSENGDLSPINGIRMKTLVHGKKTLMTEFRLDRGSLLALLPQSIKGPISNL